MIQTILPRVLHNGAFITMAFGICSICYFVEPICDKSTEKKWIDILAKRDEAVRKAEGREEEIMRIHTELEEDIKKVHKRKLLVK